MLLNVVHHFIVVIMIVYGINKSPIYHYQPIISHWVHNDGFREEANKSNNNDKLMTQTYILTLLLANWCRHHNHYHCRHREGNFCTRKKARLRCGWMLMSPQFNAVVWHKYNKLFTRKSTPQHLLMKNVNGADRVSKVWISKQASDNANSYSTMTRISLVCFL